MGASSSSSTARSSGAPVTVDGHTLTGLSAYTDVPELGAGLAKANDTTNRATRAALYRKGATDFAKDALGPFLYPPASWSIVAKGVHGPGLTTELPSNGDGPAVLWQDVSIAG